MYRSPLSRWRSPLISDLVQRTTRSHKSIGTGTIAAQNLDEPVSLAVDFRHLAVDLPLSRRRHSSNNFETKLSTTLRWRSSYRCLKLGASITILCILDSFTIATILAQACLCDLPFFVHGSLCDHGVVSAQNRHRQDVDT